MDSGQPPSCRPWLPMRVLAPARPFLLSLGDALFDGCFSLRRELRRCRRGESRSGKRQENRSDRRIGATHDWPAVFSMHISGSCVRRAGRIGSRIEQNNYALLYSGAASRPFRGRTTTCPARRAYSARLRLVSGWSEGPAGAQSFRGGPALEHTRCTLRH
jgi:hypothetical protein